MRSHYHLKHSLEDSDSSDGDERPYASDQTLETHLADMLKLLRSKISLESIDQEKKDLVASGLNKSEKTALHLLAQKSPEDLPGSKYLRPLVRFLITHDSRPLSKPDKTGDYPLHVAIKNDNKAMVTLIDKEGGEEFESAIGLPDSSQKNCIHLAIEHDLDNLMYLVDIASAEALCAKDKEGNTPLHLAADYKRCCKESIKLIEAIIDKTCEKVKVIEDPDFNLENRSPYLHHLYTRGDGGQQFGTPARLLDGQSQMIPWIGKSPEYSKAGRGDHRGPSSVKPPKPMMNASLSRSQAPIGSNGLSVSNTSVKSTRKDEIPIQSKEKSAQMRIQRDDGVAHPHNMDPSESPSENNPISSSIDWAQKVEELLMTHYLRSRGHDAAVEILYGRQGLRNSLNKAIFLDLSSKHMSKLNDIQRTLQSLDFEDMLQSVYIPRLDRSNGVIEANTARSSIEDVHKLFNGEKLKRVRKIFKIVVDDLEKPAYSDATIENTMMGKGVEIWDWRKIDLCPALIRRVAPGVKHLSLYWSGNNVVLRGWSEQDGLVKLRELQAIVVHVQENLEAFQLRIQSFFIPDRIKQVLEHEDFYYVKGDLERFVELEIKPWSEDRRVIQTFAGLVSDISFNVMEAQIVEAMTQLVKAASSQSTGGVRRQPPQTRNDGPNIEQESKEFARTVVASFPANIRTQLNEYAEVCEKKRQLKNSSKREEKKAILEARDAVKEKLREDLGEHVRKLDKDLSKFATFIAQSRWRHVRPPEIKFLYPGRARHLIGQGRDMTKDQKNAQKHRWVQCMDHFRSRLFEAVRNFEDFNIDDRIQAQGEPITVALIDDGVNIDKLDHHDGYGKIDGRSFHRDPQDPHFTKPYYESSHGHGTLMANQVYRICPKVQLLVLKLNHTKGGKDGKPCITPESAARAIEYAVERKVHIISMSWTILAPASTTEIEPGFQNLRTALLKAQTAKILLFCSASDQGQDKSLTYPTNSLKDCFKIGGADDDGVPHGAVGGPSNFNYTFPGETTTNGVYKEGTMEQKLFTGSSIATALAAGFAALILYCAQVRLVCANDENEKNMCAKAFALLKTHAGMSKAFDNVSNDSKTKYLPVWDTFERKIGVGDSAIEIVKAIPSSVSPALYTSRGF
ncbi:uncharacterized protein N7479_009078 [Penicillium vulpinum]|uniref:uncharacterized protein n=1 Tax=Penicillium vulpinum TaxID=29845 RepID=UPI00254670DD|nr:uncharacterized protein N7479_009078 [Penicillium vulpinum]KAJ5950665.1 hypothetical protein N7479_009078 [Penicillium vulpinum]